MTRLRLAGYSFVGVIAAALIVAFALGLRLEVGRGLPDLEPLLARAHDYEVTIRRDAYGVPHVFGRRDADVAFGLAYAQAEDDWDTLQDVIVTVRGTLAARQGAAAAVTDYLVQLLRVWPTTEAGYPELPAPVRALAEGYADGINLWAAEHPGRVWPGVLPVTGQDVVAGFVFRTPFFYGLDRTLSELFSGARDRELGDAPEYAISWGSMRDAPIGSNAVAVAPGRSADGHTRLLINSHQPFTGPVAWYEARLHSEEGLDIVGGVFPGSPVILHGHTRRLGWANTVNRPHLADVFRLELDPDDKLRYRFDGDWRELEVATARIRVRLFGPFAWMVERPLRFSVHGPVIETDTGTYAVRYAGMNETRHLQQYYALNRATDFSSWLDAMRLNALPSINYVYADADGNIAYIYNAQVPRRVPGWDYRSDLPGDHPELVWEDYLPFEALPMLINPPAGFVLNANHTPFRATDPADDLDPAAFPSSLNIETHMTNRGLRALELFGADSAVTAEAFEAYKFDRRYSEESELAELVSLWLAEDFNGEADMLAAQRVLAGWDRAADEDNTGAALAILAAEPVVRGAADAQEPVAALRDAVAHLLQHFGRLDVPWGEVNRLRRGNVDLPLAGGPDLLRAVYGRNDAGDGRRVAQAGDTLVYIVDWAPDGTVDSRSIHQFGSATLDADSPHYADQAPLFAAQQWKRVPLDAEPLRAETTRTYRPGRAD